MARWRCWAQNLELMRRMFVRAGAIASPGTLAGAETGLKAAMIRCAGCGKAEACRRFLDDADAGDTPPDFCANASLITRLREAAA